MNRDSTGSARNFWKLFCGHLYQTGSLRLYYYRSRLIRRLLLRARDPEALALKYFLNIVFSTPLKSRSIKRNSSK